MAQADGPFHKLRNLYLYDPITGRPSTTANNAMLALQEQANKRAERLKNLRALKMQQIDAVPTRKHCINVSWQEGSYDKAVVFDILAGKLVHDDKYPTAIARMGNVIFVRTN